MKVDDMNKYELTEAISKVKDMLNDPDIDLHFRSEDRDYFLEVAEEINNPPTDKDGYVHKYYLKDGTKSIIEVFLRSSSF